MQTLTFKIPEELSARLDQRAEMEERSKSFLIRKAVESYLHAMEEDEADFNEAIQRLKQPAGKITLEDYAVKHGLEIRTRRKGR